MALYDNKYWLLSHIRNSFISTDDTGMCELVMVGENLPDSLVDALDKYPDTDDSQEEDDEIEHESYDIQLDSDFNVRKFGSNMSSWMEKMDQKRKRAGRSKNIKWESNAEKMSDEDRMKMFAKQDIPKEQPAFKSLLSEQIQNCIRMPKNPFMEYSKFDGSAQVGVPVRKYKIFLTMLPENQKNYPMLVICVATAKIQELIGLICYKCSSSIVYGDFPLQPVSSYGLYITEEDGEVDRDFPCLDAKECVAKFGFTCLGLVEHKNNKIVTFENSEQLVMRNLEETLSSSEQASAALDESKQLIVDMELMKGHEIAMIAPLYQSYRAFIITKMRSKVEIHLGISGEKLEIDPVHQKNAKFVLSRQKPVSHHMDCIGSCIITDTKSSKTTFRIDYVSVPGNKEIVGSNSLPSNVSMKHYDFEADNATAEEIVQKMNIILDIRSSTSRKEFIATLEKKKEKKGFV